MKKVLICIISTIILIIVLFEMWKNYNLNQKQVAVLVYHNIVLTNEEKEKDTDTLTITDFEEQLKYLKDNKYETISVEDYYNWKENKQDIPEKSVIITFDDGYYSFKYLAQPILEKYNFKATCFLIGNETGEITPEYDSKKYGTIGLDEINDHSSSITYGCHTFDLHKQDENGIPIVKSKSYEELKEDLEQFNSNLFNAKYLAYPYYTSTNDFEKVLENANYNLAFVGEEEMATKNVDNYKVPRISAVKDINEFKKIFDTDKYRNKYGNGLIRKICVNFKRLIGSI